MPGIAGIVGRMPGDENLSALDTMISRMKHEEFFVPGSHIDEKLNASIGWISRSKSRLHCMTGWNDRRDVFLVVLDPGMQGSGTLDPGEIIARYDEAGDGTFAELNGWFSGVLLDLRHGKVVLFNDRFGLARIYYCEEGSVFYFASEAKSLLAILPHLRQLDVQGLGEQFSCGCVLQNRTLFQNISLLPGGSMWTFVPGRDVKKRSYFDCADWESQELLDPKEYQERMLEVFSRVLPRYFSGEQQVAVSLTGGLDSRMIMACSPKAPGELPCYSFGGMYRDCRDVSVARKVARVCGQDFRVLRMGPDMIGSFPELAERSVYLTDGTMDVSGAVELYANELAENVAPVRMTGNYGSEILRRNVAFRPTRLREELFDPDFFSSVNSAAMTYAAEAKGNTLSFIAFKQVPWHHYGRLAIEQSQLALRTPYLDNELVELAYRAPSALTTSPELQLRLVNECDPALAMLGTDRGLRVRPVPVVSKLSQKFHEFTAKAEYAYDYGMPPWLVKLDRLFARAHLERLFLGHHKFYHFRVWYRDALANYLKETLLDARSLSRFYLRKSALESMVHDHVAGRQNHTLELHKVLTCELLQRQLLEQT